MKYLLDTHTLIWSITDSRRLSPRILELLRNSDNEIFVSVISLWEISLKYKLGKLILNNLSPEDFPSLIKKLHYELITLTGEEVSTYHLLNEHTHKDPFDRMLAWQAIQRKIVVITKDSKFELFTPLGLEIFW